MAAVTILNRLNISLDEFISNSCVGDFDIDIRSLPPIVPGTLPYGLKPFAQGENLASQQAATQDRALAESIVSEAPNQDRALAESIVSEAPPLDRALAESIVSVNDEYAVNPEEPATKRPR